MKRLTDVHLDENKDVADSHAGGGRHFTCQNWVPKFPKHYILHLQKMSTEIFETKYTNIHVYKCQDLVIFCSSFGNLIGTIFTISGLSIKMRECRKPNHI